MRKITREVSDAFIGRAKLKRGGSVSTGWHYILHGNVIAEWRDPTRSELWITNAGWPTVTTRERLNALPGVSVTQHKGKQYLNGVEWNGEWTKVN